MGIWLWWNIQGLRRSVFFRSHLQDFLTAHPKRMAFYFDRYFDIPVKQIPVIAQTRNAIDYCWIYGSSIHTDFQENHPNYCWKDDFGLNKCSLKTSTASSAKEYCLKIPENVQSFSMVRILVRFTLLEAFIPSNVTMKFETMVFYYHFCRHRRKNLETLTKIYLFYNTFYQCLENNSEMSSRQWKIIGGLRNADIEENKNIRGKVCCYGNRNREERVMYTKHNAKFVFKSIGITNQMMLLYGQYLYHYDRLVHIFRANYIRMSKVGVWVDSDVYQLWFWMTINEWFAMD